jgi:tartrate-resistant acid phosphatase type 5
VIFSGEEWAAGERRDWVSGPERKGLLKSGKAYDNRFRTFPDPNTSNPLTFAALGDFGVGVSKPSTSTRRQREVAVALERISIERNVRLILTTGDNIYARTVLGIPVGSSGDEDDDWFFTFYQPYRYIINRIPVYPSIGNHDSSESEASDDRDQMLDNFFINTRFSGEESAVNASFGPGVFYKFNFGSDIEFICLDTTRKSPFSVDWFFEHPNHQRFLNAAFPVSTGNVVGVPRWRIPFSHHPPFTAGPNHTNSRSMNRHLVPLFERSCVRAVFSGHEHNFQHSRAGGIDYFVTGAGAKVNPVEPSAFDAAHTVSWAASSHFVLVDVTQDTMIVTPLAEPDPSGRISVLLRHTPRGDVVSTPIIIRR